MCGRYTLDVTLRTLITFRWPVLLGAPLASVPTLEFLSSHRDDWAAWRILGRQGIVESRNTADVTVAHLPVPDDLAEWCAIRDEHKADGQVAA